MRVCIFEKSYDFQNHKKGWSRSLPHSMDLYFLDDGSLIIVNLRLDNSITLIPPDQFEVVRTIGRNYLSHLTGKEAYDFLVEQNPTLVKNGLPNHTEYKKRVGP